MRGSIFLNGRPRHLVSSRETRGKEAKTGSQKMTGGGEEKWRDSPSKGQRRKEAIARGRDVQVGGLTGEMAGALWLQRA